MILFNYYKCTFFPYKLEPLFQGFSFFLIAEFLPVTSGSNYAKCNCNALCLVMFDLLL